MSNTIFKMTAAAIAVALAAGGLVILIGADAQLAGLRAMESWDGRHHLPHITNPTLITWGTRDCSYSFNQIQKLWRGIPNADLAVIPGAGHAAHLEKPDIFNRLVGDFLSEIKI